MNPGRVSFADEASRESVQQAAVSAVHYRARGCGVHDVFDGDCSLCQDGSHCAEHDDFDAACEACRSCKDFVADLGTIAHFHVDESLLADEDELMRGSQIWHGQRAVPECGPTMDGLRPFPLLPRLMPAATVVTNTGKGIIGGWMASVGSGLGLTSPTYIGWGTGTNTAVVGDTALQTPQNPARVNGTRSAVTTTNTNDTYQVVGTITAGGALAITEVGVFDGAGSGGPPTGANLFLRGDFAAINLANGDSIQFTVKVQFT